MGYFWMVPDFTRSLFRCLNGRGFSDPQIRQAMSASTTRFESLVSGRFDPSGREIACGEDLADRSCSQLALEGAAIEDRGAWRVSNAWASVRAATKSKPAERRKRRS
jgi:hypothetical protein